MTPALFAALAVCVVVVVRIWITSRTDKLLPEYPPRVYLDNGLGLIAVASVVRAAGARIDETTHHVGLADLGWRLLVAAAGAFLILYLEAQRTRHLINVRRVIALTWPTLLVIVALVTLWLLTPFSQGNASDALPAGDAAPWTERLYIMLFDAHLLTWTVPLSLRNWRLSKAGYQSRATATTREKSTAIGQLGMAIAAGAGSAGVAITIIRALTPGIFSLAIQTHLHSAGTVLSYIAPVAAAFGIGFPALANLLNSYQTSSLLRQLDEVLHKEPTIGNAEQSRSKPPLGIRLQPFTFAIEFYRTRIADSLRSVVFSQESALRIVTALDPALTMGTTLDDPYQWTVASDETTLHRTAFKLLPVAASSAEALNQLLAIARGYRVAATENTVSA